VDPAIKNAIANINAPQQAGESNDEYFNKTPSPMTFHQPDYTEDTESMRPPATGISEASRPIILSATNGENPNGQHL
jgi:hypothetical protein